MGVWLKWVWNATGLVEARIFRSAYNAAEYPEYSSPVWTNFSNDAHYEQNYYDAASGWALVAVLTTSDLMSGGYAGTHGGPGNAYWLYKDATWTVSGTDNEERDIYRFVTFVKDAGGNWSELSACTQNVNADRSTNYWLGDFSMDLDDDITGSSFAVEGYDLSLFTSAYFKRVPPAHARYDIGPETGFPIGENGVGKGIPQPDDTVNFYDLIPFSFNFYTTGANTWSIDPVPTTPKFENTLDVTPIVRVSRADDKEIGLGDEFTVVISLVGNRGNAVKGVEAVLEFDPNVVGLVSATVGNGAVIDGEALAVVRPIEGRDGTVGVALAGCGPTAVVDGDVSIAVITFRWESESAAQAEFALPCVRMFDAYGSTLTGSGSTLSIGAAGLVPLEYALFQNYPNPFNPSTTIRFDLRENSDVRIVIHNVLGQEVRTLVAAHLGAGKHSVTWDGRDNAGMSVTSGVYIYGMAAGDFHAIRKMFVTR